MYFTGADHNGSESWCSVTFFISLPFLECFLRVFVVVVVVVAFFFFLRIVLRFGTQFHPQ